MTEQPTPTDERPTTTSDPWSIWFMRLVQVVGLGLVIYEARFEDGDRPFLLLVASAMMLGGLGIQLVLRWLLRRVG